MSAQRKPSYTNTTTTASNIDQSTDTLDSSASEENEACVVCFKNVDIYSIGECDHPVCYECSTRMRVLCQQNECPICRQVLSKVIFTYDKLSYRELEAKNRSEYYSRKYKISFYTSEIQQAFFNLLDHPCPKCSAPPYRTFQGLKNHVRREHDLHYCDLCIEHLKIFTFERRCYTQAELGLHRAKGDPDNRSHRGHPLCEYCNKRYLDRDELFRHLRREHYFCHFCDADGCNEFYKDYDALAEHFRQDHFLCEEGKCATEQFVGAFRTEIDYKAHVSSVHGKLLNKQQAKQTRTLQLEITLGPRGRAGQNEPDIASVRSRGEDMHDEPLEATTSYAAQQQYQRGITIDAQNEQDFPSLSGGANGPNVSLTRPPPLSMRNRTGTAGLARTKENFPALGGGGTGAIGGSGTYGGAGSNTSSGPVSSMLKKPSASHTGAVSRSTPTTPIGGNGNAGMVIHVSNRPATSQHTSSGIGGATGKKPASVDFPALPAGKSKKQNRALEDDMGPPPSPVPMTNVAAKHRTLVDDYVSVAHPSHFQKIQMVQKEELEAKTRKSHEQEIAPKLTTFDFPSLGGGSSNKAAAGWVKPPSVEKKQRELENRKSKVAPAPLLPMHSAGSSSNNSKSAMNLKTNMASAAAANNNTSFATEQTTKKDKKQKDKKSASETSLQTATKLNNKVKEKNNNNNNNNENKPSYANLNTNNPATMVNGNDSAVSGGGGRPPPPGFVPPANSAVKPPPGFQSNVTLNSVAKSPNNLTFTSSLGESYSIVPTHTYAPPPEAFTRNQKLVGHFKDALQMPEAFEEFRHISQKFREGIYKPAAYYEHCQAALRDKFDKIFPELLALLPDIGKQQALYLVHTQRLNALPVNQRKPLPKMEVCSTCKQVLLQSDLDNHRKLHDLKDNFPALSSAGGVAGKTAVSNRK